MDYWTYISHYLNKSFLVEHMLKIAFTKHGYEYHDHDVCRNTIDAGRAGPDHPRKSADCK